MRYRDRNGNLTEKETGQDRFLNFLYTKRAGKMLLRLLITRPVTKFASFFLRIRPSTLFIQRFIRNYEIDMTQFESHKYRSYNDFFTRKIKPDARPISKESSVLISPCDGKASAFLIDENTRFSIKNTEYTVASLLKNDSLAETFRGGICVLLRLTVDDYHRYCYVESGTKQQDVSIRGSYHTVNPVAAACAPIYKENHRIYTLLDTARFGRILQMEVGAMMVGKIRNHNPNPGHVVRGEEKGHFEFGGSTIVLLFQKNRVKISPDILQNTGDDCETLVKMGEEIGRQA